ncbi:VOC family protein [Aeromonas simiae]|uniref:VOC family protein n=1 Tax=Aeromonas simiae TaxID=218936 RepID=UPI00266C5C26|nr:VOC family protein [Aeromonas simiae]MDO2947916.1 VOC family protein [Aeromonas simiae]MDO2955188.1 VOC family protein [Aeromonas simiae]
MVHPLDTLLGPQAPFVSSLLGQLAELGIDISHPVDHLCYRAASREEYLRLRTALAQAGELLVEGMIGGRPIATFRYHQPVQLARHAVPCIELAAPKPGRSHQAGLEHIELVVPSLSSLVAAHPQLAFRTDNQLDGRNPDVALPLAGGQVKFHLRPLEAVIAEEKATGAVIPVPADLWHEPQR